MAHRRPKLMLLRKYGVVLERKDTIEGPFGEEAERLCAFLIDCLPSGTVEEFSKLTGANMDKIFDAGNKAFLERGK